MVRLYNNEKHTKEVSKNVIESGDSMWFPNKRKQIATIIFNVISYQMSWAPYLRKPIETWLFSVK